jgi:hypothetical protein
MFQNERSSGTANRRGAEIIDMQLRAASRMLGENGIMEEGFWQTVFTSGASKVELLGTLTNYSLEAVIDGRYVAQNQTLSWTGLPDNSSVYLYAQSLEESLYTSTEFSTLAKGRANPIWNTNGLTPNQSILLVKAIITGSDITLDFNSGDSGDWTLGRPILVNYRQHRSENPIDHPDLSIPASKLQDNAVLTRTIHPWDGYSSGTGTSGTGIGPEHLKPQSIISRSLDTSLDISGLRILENLELEPAATATFNGISKYTRIPEDPEELVPLQYLGQYHSGVMNRIDSSLVYTGRVETFGSGLHTHVEQLHGEIDANALAITNLSTGGTNIETYASGLAGTLPTLVRLNRERHGVTALTSGVDSYTITLSPVLPAIPTFIGVTIERPGVGSPSIRLQNLHSGTNGGFGFTIDGSPLTTYQARWRVKC